MAAVCTYCHHAVERAMYVPPGLRCAANDDLFTTILYVWPFLYVNPLLKTLHFNRSWSKCELDTQIQIYVYICM